MSPSLPLIEYVTFPHRQLPLIILKVFHFYIHNAPIELRLNLECSARTSRWLQVVIGRESHAKAKALEIKAHTETPAQHLRTLSDCPDEPHAHLPAPRDAYWGVVLPYAQVELAL